MESNKNQRLLSKLYECQEIILALSGDTISEQHILMSEIIKELECDIIEDIGYIGI
jgi:hypothetical protein